MLQKLSAVFISCIVLILILEVLMYIDGYKKLRGFSTGGLAGESGSPAEMFRKNEERRARKTGMVRGLGSPNDVVEEEINEPISPVQDYFDMLYKGNLEYEGGLKEVEIEEQDDSYKGVGYARGATQSAIESIIREESISRGIDPDIAIKVYRAEGLNSYQSKEKYNGKRERSYGPFQLFIDGGLGNDYQKETGGDLTQENNIQDITRQIQWSLDYVAKTKSWSPWKGIKKINMDKNEGLSGSKAIGNWKD